jgi:hypothetical protein
MIVKYEAGDFGAVGREESIFRIKAKKDMWFRSIAQFELYSRDCIATSTMSPIVCSRPVAGGSPDDAARVGGDDALRCDVHETVQKRPDREQPSYRVPREHLKQDPTDSNR